MTDLTKYFKSQISSTLKAKPQTKTDEIQNTSNRYFNLYTKDLVINSNLWF